VCIEGLLREKVKLCPMSEDADRVYPLKELGEFFGLTERELETAYRSGSLELHLIARKLRGSKRQVREMLKRCRVQKNLPDSFSSQSTGAAKPCGSSKTERSERA
jgi:hypothetical protein